MKWKAAVAVAVALLGTGSVATVYAATSSTSSASATSSSSSSSAHPMRHGRPGPGVGPEDVAKVLGIDPAKLRTDLQSGKSLADIAQSKGVSESTLITDLTAQMKSQLDAAVQSGKLTSSEESARLLNFSSHVKEMVEHKGPMGPGAGRGGRHGGMGPGALPVEMAKVLGIDKATLRTDLKSGKSLADIAQSKGMSESTLIADLTAELKSRLDAAVQNGKMTSAEESTRLGDFSSHVKDMVEHKGPMGPGPGPGGGPTGWHGGGGPHGWGQDGVGQGTGQASPSTSTSATQS